jgi:hypothetical protein
MEHGAWSMEHKAEGGELWGCFTTLRIGILKDKYFDYVRKRRIFHT